ncbi:MAG: DUF4838 domain-containing protein [Kiritimatiellae bacterium]|nr:DUF4838 domain-containing protein [Kiritimatiellia bacterium]
MRVGMMATAFAFVALAAVAGPLYEIRTPEAAQPWEKRAAKELGDYLARRVAGQFAVDGRGGVVLHVGDTPFAVSKGYISSRMPDEQWLVRSYGSDILLNGGGTRGALYAVFHFLEDVCGVRWWSPQEEFVPPASPLVLDRLNLSGRPAFRMRTLHRGMREPNAGDVAARLRLNGFARAGLGFGYRYGSPNGCHTFDHYLPADKYLKDHPEWYSCEAKTGKRRGGQHGGQLCLTNPEVREQMKKRLREFIEKDRADAKKRGIHPPTIYDISENDNWTYCACTNCVAAQERWNLSGLMVDFINDIASSVRDDYPDVIVNTFAYHGTEEPPKGGIVGADNVMVRLCDTQSNMAAGMFEPGNTRFRDFLEAWSKAVRHLSIWDYAITYTRELTGLPFPSEFHYADYFRECSVRGVFGFFWEHESPHKADMWELKYFLETKLMEDPMLDSDELIATFMREYYGPAGDHVLAYRRRLDAARRAHNGKVTWFPSLSEFDWIQPEDVAACQDILVAAERATGGREPFLSRVKRVRVGMDRLVCLRARSSGGTDAPEARDAAERLKAFWPVWMERYPKSGRRRASDELVAAIGIPPPKRFAGMRIHDFPAQLINPGSGVEKTVRIVDDPESEAGRAIQVDADGSHHYNLPYTIGLYDGGASRTVIKKTFPKPLSESGYAWYEIGKAKIPDSKKSYIWLTGTWQTSLSLKDKVELFGRTFTIYASVKFTGRKYRPGSDEPSRIWIDRVVLVEE